MAQTNIGKKEQRQINQVLGKSVNEDGTQRSKDPEARTVPKQTSMKDTKMRGKK